MSAVCAVHMAQKLDEETCTTEMKISWQWFQSWSTIQRRQFLDKLVLKVTPHKLFALAEGLVLSSQTSPPERWQDCRTFEEQVAYFNKCLKRWTAEEANRFLNGLEEIDESAMNEFYVKVASTVQEP